MSLISRDVAENSHTKQCQVECFLEGSKRVQCDVPWRNYVEMCDVDTERTELFCLQGVMDHLIDPAGRLRAVFGQSVIQGSCFHNTHMSYVNVSSGSTKLKYITRRT
jgi:hypothetical protein